VPGGNGHARTGRGAKTTVTSGDGHAFVVHRTGTGAPILLLHDMAATQRAWDPVREALSWSNTIWTWDARGQVAARGTPGNCCAESRRPHGVPRRWQAFRPGGRRSGPGERRHEARVAC
jgi:pimeloyl-ACP methyl ester carboxylesterase